MPRPRRHRRILTKPPITCFRPDIGSDELIEVTLDEFEAIRLKDYHNIKQKKAAEIMGISQPTFHRTLTSARKKISKALIDGKTIVIVGGDYITGKDRYKCNLCGFEWRNPEKKYYKCPDCESNDINIIIEKEKPSTETEFPLIQRRSYGGRGVGAGPPRVCKCPECGYESPKTRGVPCRNTLCPKCETPLFGAD